VSEPPRLSIFSPQGFPELFIDSKSYLCDVISCLETRIGIKSLVHADFAFSRVLVDIAAQKAFMSQVFFAVTVTMHAVQQFPILSGQVVRFGNIPDK
jgi:tetrahydromethanopterin S-methyltransferase subunit E